MIAYRVMRAFLRSLIGVFYRQVEVVGLENVPAEGPVIFAGNHPNSLHDPMLIIALSGRIVRFAAKDVLFESAFLRPFLRSLGAVPIARRSDHGGGDVDNTKAFEALFGVLASGGAMGIFPEGLSHDDAQLARLKTGAARIALGVAAAHPGVEPRIVPCGLNYVTPKRFRSRVLLSFGPPIAIGEERVRAFRADERGAVRQLTAELEAALRALTINAEDWATLRVLDGVRRLYQPDRVTLEQRAELSRRFNEVYPKVKDHPEVRAIYGEVEEYLERLRALGLSDRDLRRRIGGREIAAKIASDAALLFVWLPLALPGLPVFLPLLGSIRLLGPRLSPRKDVVATTKLVLGMVTTLLILAALTVLVALAHGPLAGALTAVLLLVSFHATIRVLERGSAVRRLLGTLVRLFGLRREIEALRAERARLEERVVRAVERFRPPDMVPLFPREPASALVGPLEDRV